MSSEPVVGRWREAGERGDAEAAAACLSDDVVLVSPLTEQFRCHGRQQVQDLLEAQLLRLDGPKG